MTGKAGPKVSSCLLDVGDGIPTTRSHHTHWCRPFNFYESNASVTSVSSRPCRPFTHWACFSVVLMLSRANSFQTSSKGTPFCKRSKAKASRSRWLITCPVFLIPASANSFATPGAGLARGCICRSLYLQTAVEPGASERCRCIYTWQLIET
jgi:hypothetical protein